MTFETIITLITAIGGFASAIAAVVTLINNIIKSKNWTEILTQILSSMSAVEAFSRSHHEMTSKDKLDLCLRLVEVSTLARGINIDNKTNRKIIATITELCSWSKTNNVRVIGDNSANIH